MGLGVDAGDEDELDELDDGDLWWWSPPLPKPPLGGERVWRWRRSFCGDFCRSVASWFCTSSVFGFVRPSYAKRKEQ